MNAIDFLKNEHERIQGMLAEIVEKKDEVELGDLAEEIFYELELHSDLEEELFYPAVREVGPPDVSPHVADAVADHIDARDLAEEIRAMGAGTDRFTGRMREFGRLVSQHFEAEEREIFPVAAKNLDVEGLGKELEDRKEQMETTYPKPSGAKRPITDRDKGMRADATNKRSGAV